MIAEGAKRILGIPTIKKEPISVVHLQEIVKNFVSIVWTYTTSEFVLCITLCFAGFLRYSDITNLKMSNLKCHDTYIIVNIRQVKTDVNRRGNNVIVSKTGTSTCPVNWLIGCKCFFAPSDILKFRISIS